MKIHPRKAYHLFFLLPILFAFIFLITVLTVSTIDTLTAEKENPQGEVEGVSTVVIFKNVGDGFLLQETGGSSNNENEIKVKLVVAATPREKVQSNTNTRKPPIAAETKKVTPTAPQPRTTTAKISIPKIRLNNFSLYYGSSLSMADMDKKLLYGPVVENRLTAELCGGSDQNSYIYGHSEPADGVADHPGERVFSNLSSLTNGDIISVTNRNGVSCKYKITTRKIVTTDSNNRVDAATFNDLFFPVTDGKSLLTIQTCVKGSSTQRLIYRAEKI